MFKIPRLIRKVAITVTSLTILAASVLPAINAVADSIPFVTPGTISGGNIYFVRDVTQNGSFENSISNVAACNLLQFKALIYNPNNQSVSNLQLQTTLPGGTNSSLTSVLTTYSVNAQPNSTTASAAVNFASPQSLTYQSNSTQLLDQNNNLIKNLPDGITGGGVNIGDVAPSGEEFVQYNAMTPCPTPPPTPQPTYSCNLLSLTAQDNKTVEINNFTTSEANGATFSNATINWGDNTTPLVTAQPISQTHQYANYGTYTVTATANFTVNGQTKSVSGTNCAQQVTFTISTPPTVTTTTPPKQLVNTGPGNVVALFGITVAIATFGHYLFRKRQLRNY